MFAWELNFLRLLEGARTDFLVRLFEAVTIIGEELIIIFLVAITYFVFDKKLASRIFFITATSLCVNNIIKNIAKVPRPFTKGITCERVDTATGYAFPSGHTQSVATWSAAFAAKFKKPLLVLASVLLTALVAFSRMFLGAHYPSDVIVGSVLGISLAFLLNYLYDKVRSVHSIHLIAVLVLFPFAVFFMFSAQELYADFYKVYGMLVGLLFGSLFEERFVGLGYDSPWYKKAVRVLVAVAAAFAVKEGLKAVLVTDIVQLALVFDMLRYFALVFVVLAFGSLAFKKLKL